MEYIKARAFVEEYDLEDVIRTSDGGGGDTSLDDCAFTHWDATYCDGIKQSVNKGVNPQ